MQAPQVVGGAQAANMVSYSTYSDRAGTAPTTMNASTLNTSFMAAEPIMNTSTFNTSFMGAEHGVNASYMQAIEKRLADLEVAHACKTHVAFVFIKPHAVTDKVKDVVKDHLKSKGIYITSEGCIQAEVIDERSLIDTHYGAIAAKAMHQKPHELTVQPKAMEEFQKAFRLDWNDALSQGLVFNAIDGAQHLGITTEELGQMWGKLKKGNDLLKFGGGFYCGRVNSIFIINGFYMDMRAKFTTPGTCIYYFETEWDPRALSWKSFRGEVLGATDPSTAARGSLRNIIYNDWKKLGLEKRPDTGDNAVHASASPFEALAERSNWLANPIYEDFYGRAMLGVGVPHNMIDYWCSDPVVNYQGNQQSFFDLLEDLDGRECLYKIADIAQSQTPL